MKQMIIYKTLGGTSEGVKRTQPKRKKNRRAVCCSTMTEADVRYVQHESTMQIFRTGMGRSTKKHGARGGVCFSKLQTIYASTDCEEHRDWRRGEKVHYRSSNRKGLSQTLKDENFTNIMRANRYGVVYKSNPCALKY